MDGIVHIIIHAGLVQHKHLNQKCCCQVQGTRDIVNPYLRSFEAIHSSRLMATRSQGDALLHNILMIIATGMLMLSVLAEPK